MISKRHPPWFVFTLILLDMIAAAIGFASAYLLRFKILVVFVPPKGGYTPADYIMVLPAALAAWPVALNLFGFYSPRRRILDWPAVGQVFKASLVATAIFLAFLFAVRPASRIDPSQAASFSRIVVACWVFCSFLTVVLMRWLADRVANHFRRRHHVAMARVAIVGNGPVSEQIIRTLRRKPEYGRHLVGMIRPDADAEISNDALPILGSADNLLELVREHNIDELIITQPDCRSKRLQEMLAACERDLIEFRIVPDSMEMLFTDLSVEDIGGIPFLGLRETSLYGWNVVLKRVFDFTIGAILLALFSIPMLIVAALIRAGSKGPALYRQERVGVDGRRFTIFKFRSMRVDAEENSGPLMAAEDDPRVTKIGGFLRRYRIDEWPQLFNVILGEMSLVGPRPERPHFVSQFKQSIPRYMARHRVKSGVTGLAQVNGFSGPRGSIEQRLFYDIRYIESWSWWLDFVFLSRTFFCLFRPRTQPLVDHNGVKRPLEEASAPVPEAKENIG